MNNNILVCGGLPKSATTFLYTEISNYENVFRSRIKESYLFLINMTMSKFTDAVQFVNDNFLTFKFDEIRTNSEDIKPAIKYAKASCRTRSGIHIPTWIPAFAGMTIDDVFCCRVNIIKKIQTEFNVNFGLKLGTRTNRNASNERRYYALSYLNSYFKKPLDVIR
jgi:hypothetical protein